MYKTEKRPNNIKYNIKEKQERLKTNKYNTEEK